MSTAPEERQFLMADVFVVFVSSVNCAKVNSIVILLLLLLLGI